MMLAVVLGGAIGLERELKAKPAGLRTNILICVGATLLTHVSMTMVMQNGSRVGDPARLAAQIVTGVGFLGPATIMQDSGMVTGLPPAATICVAPATALPIAPGDYT